MTGGSLSEQLDGIQTRLEATDEMLDGLSSDVEALLEQALADVSVEVSHDLETGRLVASIPLEELARVLEERIDEPYFVRVAGSRIIIGDFRTVHADLAGDIAGFESDSARAESVKTVLERIEQEYGRAVPEESLLSTLSQLGLPAEDARTELRTLKQDGVVYEPMSDHYSLA